MSGDQENPARSDSRLSLRAFILVVLLAAVLRLVWMIAIPVMPVSDSLRYDLFARNLASGAGYATETGKTAYFSVGPSFLFSLAYRFFGVGHDGQYLPIAVMNLILGVGSVALTMHLATRWFSPRIGLVSGLILALWPSQIEFTTVLASETPFIFLILAALAVWCRDRPAWWARAVLTGVLLAGASYMRPVALLLPVVFAVVRMARRREWFTAPSGAIVSGAVMIALILPWSMRNQRVFDGQFVLIATNGGPNFWMGNNPETSGYYQKLPELPYKNEVDRDKTLKKMAMDYIKDEPIAFVKRTLVKAIRLHDRETIGVHWNEKGLEARLSGPAIQVIKWGGQAYWLSVLVLALVGVGCSIRRWGLLWTLFSAPLLMWTYFVALHAVTVIQDRYHFPIIPFVAMFAAVGLLAAIRLGRSSQA